MVDPSKAMKKACCFRIKFKSNCFWLFVLDFGLLFRLFFFVSFLWQLCLLGLSIFTNPNLWLEDYFGNLDFIQILITKYAIRSLKAIGNIYLFIMLFVNCICGLK